MINSPMIVPALISHRHRHDECGKALSQANRMNAVIMVRERLSAQSSPDKGRTGGVCGNEIGFFVGFAAPNPLILPLSRGKWVGDRCRLHLASFMRSP
jgi:hypothetical protein